MAKPSALPRWATDESNNTEPSSGQKDTGWTPGQDGVSDYDNWYKKLAYDWTSYLNDGYFEGVFGLVTEISPAAISGNTDNYNPTGLSTASVIRQDLSGTTNLRGLAGGAAGRVILLVNIHASNTLTIKDSDANSTDVNRFHCLNSEDVVLRGRDSAALLRYDGVINRWLVFVISSSPIESFEDLYPWCEAMSSPGDSEWVMRPTGWTADGAGTANLFIPLRYPVGTFIHDIDVFVNGDASETVEVFFRSMDHDTAGTPDDIQSETSAAADTDQTLAVLNETLIEIEADKKYWLELVRSGSALGIVYYSTRVSGYFDPLA